MIKKGKTVAEQLVGCGPSAAPASPHLQLLDGLPALADDQAGLSCRDHDLLHRAVLAPIGVVMELSRGAPTTPRHDVIQHHLRFPGEGKNGVLSLERALAWRPLSPQLKGKVTPTSASDR